MFPQARLAVGGRMSTALERIMNGSWKEIRYLISTTIIGQGWIYPTSAIIIYDADHFGLSHRSCEEGGRSAAWPMLPDHRREIVSERPEAAQAIRNSRSWTPAMALRDLEIRGAGNFWGRAARVYGGVADLHRLLEEEVAKLQGHRREEAKGTA